VRRLLDLDQRTYTWILPPLPEQIHISLQLYVQTLIVLYHTLQHEHSIIFSIGKTALSSATSPIGQECVLFPLYIYFTDSLSPCINRVHSRAQICSE